MSDGIFRSSGGVGLFSLAWTSALTLGFTGCERAEPTEPTGSALVLSEVDYDQPGLDDAEFIELHNRGSEAYDLRPIVLVLLNGTAKMDESGYIPAEYRRATLASLGSLPAGGFLVISGAPHPMSQGTRHIDSQWSAQNALQNGAHDAILLVDTVRGALLDGFSYEGALPPFSIKEVPERISNLPEVKVDDSAQITGSLVRTFVNGEPRGWDFTTELTPGSPNKLVPPTSTSPGMERMRNRGKSRTMISRPEFPDAAP